MILGLFIYFGYCVTSPPALSEHPDLFESNLPNLPLTQITHTTFLFSYFQENDEEIGALGSILSWDDEEEAAVSAAVAATGSALDERDSLSSLPTLPPFTGYPQQISIIAMQQGPAQAIQQMQANTQAIQQSQLTQQPFQMMVQNVQGYATQQQPAYAQQPGQTQHQMQMAPTPGQNQQQATQQAQQGQTYAAPSPAQQQQMMQVQAQQVISATPAQQNQMQQVQGQQQIQTQIRQQQQAQQQRQTQQQQTQQVGLSQQQQQQAMSNGRQMLANGSQSAQAYQTMYQQQMFANATPDQVSMQSMSLMQAQPQQAQDPNAFLRQMQLQYQQVPGSTSRALQQAPIMMQQQQQPQMMAPAPVPPQARQPTRRAPVKRKAVDVKPPAAPKSTVVSCSDTDGETRASSQSSKKAKKSNVDAASMDMDDFEAELANMTPAEKAKANRDRNREHARNTRLRKKAYLEQLKMTVDELCLERDTLVSERAGASNILVEMHNTRTEVLMSFFALRSVYEKQRELWASILEESCFACVMPVTPYRSFPASEVQVSKCQRTVLGIDGMMADTASLHVLLNNLVDRSRFPTATIQFRYTLVTEDAVVAGNQMMARWVMSTVNATQFGARMEVAKQGMLCCKFNSAHKIVGLELMFDVMAFMLQLKQATGSHEFAVVPNTVQTCQRAFKIPMVITLAERPYTIVQVNKLWEEMTGFKAEEVVGRASCRILQGQESDRKGTEKLMNEVRFKRPAAAVLLNYTKQGTMFRNYMNVYPLSTDSKITHYVALTGHSESLDSVSGQASGTAEQAVQVPPATIAAPVVLPSGLVKPTAQLMHPQPTQATRSMNPPTQLMMHTQPTLAAHGGVRQVAYYQTQPGILPKQAAGMPVLQTMANTPAAIAPRGAQTIPVAAQPRQA
jgi:PAS domain S-box-containing protein